KNLRVCGRGPASENVQKQEHQNAAEQAREHVERGGAHAHGKEEELPFHSEHRERAIQRAVNRVDSSCVRHVRATRCELRSWKKPREEVDCGDGHADTEEHTRKDSFGAALTKS